MTLYVVATPIGNLEDLTPRARRVLGEVDAVIAEDTRHTRGLLAHCGLSKPLVSLPAFDEAARVGPIVERLQRGESMALCTDAGTPAVSDPGEALVDAARDAGVAIVPIPGASAAIAALSSSGLASSRFSFFGFLPRKGSGRREAIDELKALRMTAIIDAAGNRTGERLAELADALGPRRALVARELTKLHEETVRATLPDLADRFRDGARGEVVLVIEPPAQAAPSELPPIDDEIARRLAAGEKATLVAKTLAATYALPRQQIYARCLALKPRAEDE